MATQSYPWVEASVLDLVGAPIMTAGPRVRVDATSQGSPIMACEMPVSPLQKSFSLRSASPSWYVVSSLAHCNKQTSNKPLRVPMSFDETISSGNVRCSSEIRSTIFDEQSYTGDRRRPYLVQWTRSAAVASPPRAAFGRHERTHAGEKPCV